ncbi:MAG TPA: hypothetical protein VD997_01995 [Phycisphaerales bacterium]|nr:hypothetical protein [Phycisphaerales bacterium]
MHPVGAPILRRSRAAAILTAIWLVGLIGGTLTLAAYEQTPSSAFVASYGPDRISQVAQAALHQKLNKDGPTLIMFAHPFCPCTRASVAELHKLCSRNPGAAAHVLFFRPEKSEKLEWGDSALHEAARKIPGATLGEDRDGRIAASLGVSTSGTVLVLSSAGQVLFVGGITSGRGHQGDNAGADAVEAALRSQAPFVNPMPAYGCSLITPDSCARCDAGEEAGT